MDYTGEHLLPGSDRTSPHHSFLCCIRRRNHRLLQRLPAVGWTRTRNPGENWQGIAFLTEVIFQSSPYLRRFFTLFKIICSNTIMPGATAVFRWNPSTCWPAFGKVRRQFPALERLALPAGTGCDAHRVTWEAPVATVVSFAQVCLATMVAGIYVFNWKMGSTPFILLRDSGVF